MGAGQQVNYTVTSTGTGDLTVDVVGASAPRTVTILDSTGAQKATGVDGTTLAAAPAGTYTIRVGGAAASAGGTVTDEHGTARLFTLPEQVLSGDFLGAGLDLNTEQPT